MLKQECSVLILTPNERKNRFKDKHIQRSVEQADLVLEDDTFSRPVVIKDKYGLFIGGKQ